MSSALVNYVGIGKEDSYGTEAAPTHYIPVKESDGVTINQDVQFNEAIKGTAPKNKGAFAGRVEITGNYEADVYPNFLGMLLLSALGSVTTTTVAGSVKSHAFTETIAKPSLTIEQKFGEIIKRVVGFIPNTLSFEVSAGEPLSMTVEGFAQNQADETEGTPSYETARPFNFADVTEVLIGAQNVTAKVEELSLEYTNGMEGFYALGDTNNKNQYATPSEAKGSMTLYLDTQTKDFLADYIAGTQRLIKITVEGEVLEYTHKNSLVLEIPAAVLTAVNTPLSMDYNALEIEFEAVEDPTDGIFKATLQNVVASY